MKSKIDEVKTQVESGTPADIIALIAKQLERAADAARRIEEEGLVVRDLKGGVIPHPAIKIEQEATEIACRLLDKHKRFEL